MKFRLLDSHYWKEIVVPIWPTEIQIVTINAGWLSWYLKIFHVTDYESELTI